MSRDAFLSFRDNLRLNARNFPKRKRGEARRPVLLVQGDTNPYCMDKDFGGQQAPNLWRLNAWGDYQNPADATVITVRADDRQNPFAAQTLLGQKVPAARCE